MKIFFLPGWAGGAEDFSALIKNLPNSFQKKILYEAPISASSNDKNSFESFSATLSFALKDETEPFFLCGYSMGGRFAIVLADLLKDKKKFAGLILLSVGLGIESEQEKEIRWQSDRGWADLLRRDSDLFWRRWYEQEIFKALQLLPSLDLQVWKEKRLLAKPEVLAADLEIFSQSRHDYLLPRLKNLTRKPVLYISGAEDKKYTAIGAQLKSSIREITVLNIPGVGHILPLEAPAKTAQAIVEWAQGLSKN